MENKNYITSPLEKLFDIEDGSTLSQFQPSSDAAVEGQIISTNAAGEIEHTEDEKIKAQLNTIYEYALEAFENQTAIVQGIDPKFAARNSEVAAQFLALALNSVNVRETAKFKRQKIRLSQESSTTPNTVNNNIIVADRNELLKTFLKGSSDE